MNLMGKHIAIQAVAAVAYPAAAAAAAACVVADLVEGIAPRALLVIWWMGCRRINAAGKCRAVYCLFLISRWYRSPSNSRQVFLQRRQQYCLSMCNSGISPA